MDIKIRNATLVDIPSILGLAQQIERFVSGDEIRTFLQIDPEAMFVAKVGGRIIGSCCATRLSSESGHIGLYIVLQEYRGKGIGMKLWKAAKEHLGERNIGIGGEPEIFKKYTEKDSFSHVEDYSMIFYECFGDSLPKSINVTSDIEVATYFEGNFVGLRTKLNSDETPTGENKFHTESGKIGSSKRNFDSNTICTEEDITLNIPNYEKSSRDKEYMTTQSGYKRLSKSEYGTKHNIGVRHNSINPNDIKNSIAEDILSKVVSFDKHLHKRDRSLIVRQTVSWSSCRTKVALQGCKVVGYACLRKVVTEHWLISPFYADSIDVAEILLFELLQEFDFSLAPKGIQIRFPDKNSACKGLAEKFGFRQDPILILTGFTKQCVNIDTSKVYSFHSTVFCSE